MSYSLNFCDHDQTRADNLTVYEYGQKSNISPKKYPSTDDYVK